LFSVYQLIFVHQYESIQVNWLEIYFVN